MKKAISIWSFPFDWPLDRKLAVAREAGFAGFEIDLTESGPVGMTTSAEDLRAVRRAVESAGLQLSGLATGM